MNLLGKPIKEDNPMQKKATTKKAVRKTTKCATKTKRKTTAKKK